MYYRNKSSPSRVCCAIHCALRFPVQYTEVCNAMCYAYIQCIGETLFCPILCRALKEVWRTNGHCQLKKEKEGLQRGPGVASESTYQNLGTKKCTVRNCTSTSGCITPVVKVLEVAMFMSYVILKARRNSDSSSYTLASLLIRRKLVAVLVQVIVILKVKLHTRGTPWAH